MNELLRTAYAEIEKLKNERPSWDVYNRINALRGSILYLQKFIKTRKEVTSIDEAVDDMVENAGKTATIEFLKRLLNELKNDMDIVSPQISAVIIKRLKERYETDV